MGKTANSCMNNGSRSRHTLKSCAKTYFDSNYIQISYANQHFSVNSYIDRFSFSQILTESYVDLTYEYMKIKPKTTLFYWKKLF